MENLKQFPTSFAKDNATPWLHRYLYKDQMPPSMQACLTVCTLFANMNSSNKASAVRILYQSLEELKSLGLTNTPRLKLAQAQALFMYQIIGLFDGDVTLRSDTDRSMPLLQQWLNELCRMRENLETPQNTTDPHRPRSWEVSAPIILVIIIVDISSGGYSPSL